RPWRRRRARRRRRGVRPRRERARAGETDPSLRGAAVEERFAEEAVDVVGHVANQAGGLAQMANEGVLLAFRHRGGGGLRPPPRGSNPPRPWPSRSRPFPPAAGSLTPPRT